MQRDGQALSPFSQATFEPSGYITIHVVFHLQRRFDFHALEQQLQDTFPFVPSLSYLTECDKDGVLRWRKTEIKLKEHFVWPEVPSDLQDVDEFVEDYVSNVSFRRFDESIPPWDIHVLNCRSSRGESTLLMRFHHSLGDGISLMSFLLSFATCEDDPFRDPRFPQPRKRGRDIERSSSFLQRISVRAINLTDKFIVVKNTLIGVAESLLSSYGLLKDTHFPTKSLTLAVTEAFTHSAVSFLLDDIKCIKDYIRGTVNDVLFGIIFYGFKCYMEIRLAADVAEISLEEAYEKRFELLSRSPAIIGKNTRISSYFPTNIRLSPGYQKVEEMFEDDSQAPWGNRVGLVRVSVPLGKMNSPLGAVRIAKKLLDRKKNSFEGFIAYSMVKYSSARASEITRTLGSSSIFISNIVGPTDRICMWELPVESFSFFIRGVPQAVQAYIISYVDKLVIRVVGCKSYVDARVLSKILEESTMQAKTAATNTSAASS